MEWDFPTGQDQLPKSPRPRVGLIKRRPFPSLLSEFLQTPSGGVARAEPNLIPSRSAPPLPLAKLDHDTSGPLELIDEN